MAHSPHAARRGSRPAWVEVDLDALTRNLSRLRTVVEPAGVLAVVKADAYGHGALAVAKALVHQHVDWLGVALVEEGVELREAGIQAPVLLLGPIRREQMRTALKHELVPAISSLGQLDAWADELTSRPSEPALPVHLKLDSGMHRLGIPPSQWQAALERVASHAGLDLGGVLSHLADTQTPGSAHNRAQEECFARALAVAEESSAKPVLIHLASSAPALHRPGSRHSMVRAGLSLLGIDPTGRDDQLEPVMAVRGLCVHHLDLEPGERIGYNGEWVAARRSRIGVLQVGYADGYPWRLGNRAEVLVAGTRAPVVGAVSMDMLAVDLTDVEVEVEEETIVTLLGRDGADSISATELARRAGVSTYELLCHFGLRLPKVHRGLRAADDSRS